MALGNYRGPSSYKAFVRYVYAVFRREIIDRNYRIYVTDALNNIPQMKYTTLRWADTLESTHVSDNRSADEIVDDVIAALSGGE